MLALARGQFLFRRPDGANYLLKRGVLTPVPDWVAEDPWFRDLCSCGMIAVPETTKDTAVEKAVETAEKVEKKKKKTKK